MLPFSNQLNIELRRKLCQNPLSRLVVCLPWVAMKNVEPLLTYYGQRPHIVSEILVNTVSFNGLLPETTKLLPEPILTPRNYSWYLSVRCNVKLLPNLPGVNELSNIQCSTLPPHAGWGRRCAQWSFALLTNWLDCSRCWKWQRCKWSKWGRHGYTFG